MNAISSYVRHVIVTFIVLLATKWQLPEAGLSDFAEGVALLAIGTITWLLVKYAPELAKFLGISAIALLACLILPACSLETPDSWSKDFNPLDPPGGTNDPEDFRTPINGPNWYR